jgi:protein ImuB
MFAALYLPSLSGRTADTRAQLMAVAREFSPRVERLGEELLALDVSGLGRWFENWGALGEALRRTAADRGLAAHVAVAATRTAAVLCARGRAGLTVALAGEEAARLAPLPLNVLTAWAVGSPHTAPIATFRRWGLKTLGDLANLPGTELSERLGQAGIMWQRLASGEDLQPLVPVLPDEHYEESLELEWPIEQLEPLSFVLGRLLEVLCVRLEQADRGVAVLHVRLDLAGVSGRQRFARALQLPAPMRDARTLRTLALLDLESNPPPWAIDRVTVAADVVEGRVLQFSLLARAFSPERLSTLLARLSALMGSDRVGAPALVDSYRPGAFAMAPFTAVCGGQWAVGRASFNAKVAEDAKFLKIDSSATSVPSASSALKKLPVVRRFRQPIPARVDVQQGRPMRVTSNRRHLRGGYVEVSAGPWRSSGSWWKAPAAAATHGSECKHHSSMWDRDEWEVALRDAAVYLIFQDRERGCWFIDGMLD